MLKSGVTDKNILKVRSSFLLTDISVILISFYFRPFACDKNKIKAEKC